jgi:uncharacterized protein YbjT (DUF2867 family)
MISAATESTLPPLAVTGATGTIGGQVARILADAGVAQRLLVRRVAKAPDLPRSTAVNCSYGDRAPQRWTPQRHLNSAAEGRRCRRASRGIQLRATRRVGGVALPEAAGHRARIGGAPGRVTSSRADRPLPHQYAGAGDDVS